MNIFFYDTCIGRLGIAESDGCITNILLHNDEPPINADTHESKTIKEAFRQINLYLNGNLKNFSLKLKPSGTPYMKTVWNELTKIPYGETRSYKQVAEACGKSRGARAAGMIIGRNPIPIVIPCHRVIGSSGKLVGFRSGLEIKKKLLELEKRPQQHRITSDEND